MAGIDEVLERLLMDTEFARNLAQDPASALAGYELTADDLSLLSSQVSFDPGALSLVEERISKSSMFGLLTSMTGGLAGLGGDPGLLPEPHYDPVPHLGPEPLPGSGIIGPDDPPGLVDPGDKGVPDGADGIIIVDGAPADDAGGGGGAGSEVAFKEVEPGLPPDGDAQGIVVIGGAPADDVAHGAGGGGGGAGSEVAFKEVEPGLPPDGDAQGFIVEDGIGNPDNQPGDARGMVIEGGIGNPEIQPGEGIIVQNG